MNIKNATVSRAEYTKREDRSPRLEFMVDERRAFISDLREDYFAKGFVRLFSFDLDTNWEELLPVVKIRIEDRQVTLLGYTNDERIKILARQFKDDLENDEFVVGFQPNLKTLFERITQL